MSHIEISGKGPPSAAEAKEIMVAEGRRAMNKVNATVHREVLARMARHRKTGHSMRSVFARLEMVGSLITGVIGSNLNIVKFHEYGTGIYGPRHRYIVPTKAQALRWPNRSSGAFTLAGRVRAGKAAQAQYNFARRVRGIRPLRYFYDAHIVTQPKALVIFKDYADTIARRLGNAAKGRS